MSGPINSKPSSLLVLVTFFLLAHAYPSAGTVSVVSAPVAPSNSSQVLDNWCSNLTSHLNTTLEKFGSVTFNRTTGLLNMSATGVTELQRLAFDLGHVKVYSLLFGQIPSFMISQRFSLCLTESMRQMGGLIAGMGMAESFLNGTSPSPPQFLHGVQRIGNQTRYQDLSREMAVLKGQMRELVIILGSNLFGSARV